MVDCWNTWSVIVWIKKKNLMSTFSIITYLCGEVKPCQLFKFNWIIAYLIFKTRLLQAWVSLSSWFFKLSISLLLDPLFFTSFLYSLLLPISLNVTNDFITLIHKDYNAFIFICFGLGSHNTKWAWFLFIFHKENTTQLLHLNLPFTNTPLLP